VIGSRWWSTGHEGYRKILSKPQVRNWLLSLLVLALAVTGIVRIIIRPDAPPKTEIASDAASPDQSLETETLTPTDADTEKAPIPEAAKPEERQPADQKDALSDEKPAQDVTAADKPDAPPAQETAASDAKPPALLQVKGLSIGHDSLNNLYRADFTIVKNIAAEIPDPVSGYAFIHLNTQADENDTNNGLLIPSGELDAGRPTEIRRGAPFSIRNLIKMRVKTVSTVPPESISNGKLLVYSPEGKLLLDQPFKVPIQPFFSPVAEKPTAPGDNKTAKEAPPKPAPEPKPAPKPKPQIAERESLKPTPQPETQDTSPAVASTPAPVKEPLRPVETVEPLAGIKKTDHPDAAIWEQKSYDAAVKGNFDRAIADATKAIELDPGRVNPYINRSWAYIEKDMLGQAINDCKVALYLDPKNTFAYNNRGLAFQRSNQTAKAQSDYRSACELGLDLGCQNLNSLVNQSRIAELIESSKTAFKAKNWDGVIRATTAVIKIDPQNSVAYTNRSAAYAQKNYLAKALKDSNEAIKHDPQFSLAYNNRGYVFELLGNDRKAAADYLKSCSLGLNLGCKNFDKMN
jgi:outer membrane biosynthesis protein TonB